jgi:hypothetical protein
MAIEQDLPFYGRQSHSNCRLIIASRKTEEKF